MIGQHPGTAILLEFAPRDQRCVAIIVNLDLIGECAWHCRERFENWYKRTAAGIHLTGEYDTHTAPRTLAQRDATIVPVTDHPAIVIEIGLIRRVVQHPHRNRRAIRNER